MALEDKNVDNQPSYLEMSDEDLMKAGPPTATALTDVPVEFVDNTSTAEKDNTVIKADEQDDEDENESGDEGAGEGDGTEPKPEPKNPLNEDDVEKPDVKKPLVEKKDPDEKPDTTVINFEAEYNRLLSPFKANGREVEVKSIDDAIALMQMGANYNKKMSALKPNLKLMKMLENNGLMSEEKIGYLIDLDRKDPNAITKLVKDSGISPMDLDVDKASEYQPKIHAVNETEMELDTVLDDLRDSPSYNQTLQIVGQKWDGASKKVIANSPELLKVINSHVETGIYALISKEVESERVFGRLNGLSDIEAYRQIGDAIQLRGGFNHLGSSQKNAPTQAVIVTPKPKQDEDDKLKDKRRAAGSTRPAASTPSLKEFNPLGMSDEEFSKVSVDRFR